MKIVLLYFVLVTWVLAACTPGPAPPTPTPTADPIALGQDVFARVCARCHGENAEGHAYPPAPALDGSEHAWHHPDVQLRDWIKHGKLGFAEMPPYGDQLTDAEIEAVIAYFKSLWPEEKRTIQESINERYPTPEP